MPSTRLPVFEPLAEHSNAAGLVPPPRPVIVDAFQGQIEQWRHGCKKSEGGKLLQNLVNVMAALCEFMPLTFAFDQMLRLPMVMRSLDGERTFVARPLADNDVTRVRTWPQDIGLHSVGQELVLKALVAHSHECEFHPVKDYLNSLQWDGQPRIENLFPHYFGAERTDYTRGIGRYFLIAMVARIFNPGCQWKRRNQPRPACKGKSAAIQRQRRDR
jgi:hypothetical protein